MILRSSAAKAAACGIFGMLAFALWTDSAAAAQEDIAAQIKGIEQSIASVDVELGRHDTRIENCDLNQYYRQKRYWQLRRQIAQENRDALTLRKEILEARLPDELTAKLEELQKRAESRTAAGASLEQARTSWQRVEGNMQKVQMPYSWHLTKLNLLRDLVHRCRRIRFYLQEAIRPLEWGCGNAPLPQDVQRERLAALMVKGDRDSFELGPVYGTQGSYRIKPPLDRKLDELTTDTSRWLEQYGECFYGVREQPVLGQVGQAEALLELSEALVRDFEDLERRREALTGEVLEFLASFDGDGKFDSLGIPYRTGQVTVDGDGRPSELLFCSMGGAHGGSRQQEEPLCFDVYDFIFGGFSPKAVGEIETESPHVQALLKQVAADAEKGYYFKQPVLALTGGQSRWVNPRLLPEDQQDDEDLFLRNADGGHSSHANIWHPAVRQMLDPNFSALARVCKTIPNFLFYDKVTWEPAFVATSQGSKALEAGYSPQAIEAFRAYLEEKFGDIGALNEAWRTEYSGFEAIEPPPDPYVVRRRWTTPLWHEFELFRMESHIDYFSECVNVLRREDPEHPVAIEIGTLTGHFATAAADSFRMMTEIPAQYIEDHYNNWHGSYSSLRYLYDLCLYAGKIPIEMEYIWTYPRLISPRTEDQFRVTGELSIWRKLVWGRKVLHPFGTFDGWGYRHNYMDEAYSCELGWDLGPSGRLVREAGTSIPMAKKRAREFWSILDSTEVAKPKIAVLVPATTRINEYPYKTPWDSYSAVATEMIRLERFLGPRDLDFRFVPEQVILSGREDLSGFEVLIVPYAPFFPAGLADGLLDWTERGGTLICSGVPGVYDPYGFEDGELVERAFDSRLRYEYSGDEGDWRWRLRLAPGDKPVDVLVSEGTNPVMVSTRYGQGRALLFSEAFDVSGQQRKLQSSVLEHLEQAIGSPTAFSARHRFELVTREDAAGQRYLFIVNPHLDDAMADYVTVDGEYGKVLDLGIGSHCEVPLAPREPRAVDGRYYTTSRHTDGTTVVSVRSAPGLTTFQMRLAPGEGTVLKLAK